MKIYSTQNIAVPHLCTPIAQIVYRDDIPPTRLVQIRQERTDNCAPQMPHMEAFGDIGRGVLYDDFLSFSQGVFAVF
jgi:hypothetical protein